MGKIIKCKIFKEDFEEVCYIRSSDCPITKAVKRAGIHGVHTGHHRIEKPNVSMEIGKIVDHPNVTRKVRRMCDKEIEPEYIEFEVELL